MLKIAIGPILCKHLAHFCFDFFNDICSRAQLTLAASVGLEANRQRFSGALTVPLRWGELSPAPNAIARHAESFVHHDALTHWTYLPSKRSHGGQG